MVPLIREVPAEGAGINVVEMTATMEEPKALPSENGRLSLAFRTISARTYKVKGD